MLGAHPDYVVLVVEDVARSLEFYAGVLDLPVAHRAGTYAQLDTGPTRVGLYARAAMSATLGRPRHRRHGAAVERLVGPPVRSSASSTRCPSGSST